jgi:hypothetical protein
MTTSALAWASVSRRASSCRVDLVHHDEVGGLEHGLARMVAVRVVGSQGVDHDEVQIGAKKREVVVPAVPDDDVGARGRLRGDARVVDAGEHDVAGRQVRLVFLPLLDGAAGGVQSRDLLEALRALALEIRVGHRVTEDGHAPAARPQPRPEPARDRRLPATGSHRGDRDDRDGGAQHRALGAQQDEVGAGGERARRHAADSGGRRSREAASP